MSTTCGDFVILKFYNNDNNNGMKCFGFVQIP